jgi:hypothetical protein
MKAIPIKSKTYSMATICPNAFSMPALFIQSYENIDKKHPLRPLAMKMNTVTSPDNWA